jgi:hypothetical protein
MRVTRDTCGSILVSPWSAVNVRFDTLHRLIVQVSGAMIIAVIATLVSVLATRV